MSADQTTTHDKGAEAERAAFEAYAQGEGWPLHRYPKESGIPYSAPSVEGCWQGWLARARRPTPAAVAEELPPLKVFHYDIHGSLRRKGEGFHFEYGRVGDYVCLKDAQDAIIADRLARASVPAAGAVQQPVAWALRLKSGVLEFNSGYGMFQTRAQADAAHRQHFGSVAVEALYTAPQASVAPAPGNTQASSHALDGDKKGGGNADQA